MLSKAFPFMMLIGMATCATEDNSNMDVPVDNSTIGLFNEEQDDNDDPPESIIEGVELTRAERKKRPYLVTVLRRNSDGTESLCGGSIISPNAVLTAAHCLFDGGVVSPSIRVDFNRWALSDTSGFFTIPITLGSAVPHDNYDPSTLNNDVAILFLDTQVSITPIILNTDQNVPGSTGVPLDVAGWGNTSNDGKPGDVLKATTINYVTTFDCTRPPYNWPTNEVTDSMMCAIGDGTTAHCSGDSGKSFHRIQFRAFVVCAFIRHIPNFCIACIFDIKAVHLYWPNTAPRADHSVL